MGMEPPEVEEPCMGRFDELGKRNIAKAPIRKSWEDLLCLRNRHVLPMMHSRPNILHNRSDKQDENNGR